MGRALIVYATRTGSTEGIARLLAEGLESAGHETRMAKVSLIKTAEDLSGYDGYAFGSATYHGEMMTSMKQMLFLAEKAGLTGKPGGAFGAFGWSGEAPVRIFETMEKVFNMKMAASPLMIKAAWSGDAGRKAGDYASELARMIGRAGGRED